MAAALTESAWIRLSNIADERRMSKLFADPAISSLHPILIKGWSVARFYDDGSDRVSSDIDILFSEVQSPDVIDLIRNADPTAAVDVHCGLRHLDKLSFDELFARSYEVELNGVPVRVLADEDNLRITAVHWLTDGGVNKDKLWDIYYLVKNRKADFDWNRCLESGGPIRKTWVLAAIATARDHLALDISDLPDEVRVFRLPDWYQRTLEREWQLGIYPRFILANILTRPKLLAQQLRRKFPPNPIASTVLTETPIDDTSRVPAQVKSFAKKLGPFARGLGRRLTYSFRERQS